MKIEIHRTFTYRMGGSAATPTRAPAKPVSPGVRLLMAVIGLWLLGAQLSELRREYRLKTEGVPAQGQVIGISWNSGKNGPRYRVRFGYITPDGARHAATGRISRDSYRRLRPGDGIGIYYVPAEPRLAETAELRNNVQRMAISGIFGLPVALFLLVMAFSKKPRPAPDPTAPSDTYQFPKIIS